MNSVKQCLKLLTVIMVVQQVSAQDLSLYQSREFTHTQGVLPYRVLFPANYEAGKKFPLVLVLHGAGERGNDNEKQLTHGAKLFLREEVRTDYPAIVLFPQCPSEEYWSSVQIDRSKMPYPMEFDYEKYPLRWPLAAAIALVEEFKRQERVDEKRVYITGLSMGGMGTFEAVYRYPKLFAAALPICGGGDAIHYGKQMKKIPFWIFHGDKDGVVDVKLSREMVARLKELKANVKYTEYPGVNHNSWDNAFAEPDYLRWMFSWKK